MISLIYCKILPLSLHVLFRLLLDSSKFFGKALVVAIPFLPFKGTTYAYLLKILITHNKKRIPLLNLLTNSISARLAPQILSIKDECTFRFSNFLIIGLSNFSVNCWFDIFSF